MCLWCGVLSGASCGWFVRGAATGMCAPHIYRLRSRIGQLIWSVAGMLTTVNGARHITASHRLNWAAYCHASRPYLLSEPQAGPQVSSRTILCLARPVEWHAGWMERMRQRVYFDGHAMSLDMAMILSQLPVCCSHLHARAPSPAHQLSAWHSTPIWYILSRCRRRAMQRRSEELRIRHSARGCRRYICRRV
jgi:hypothetical protein